MGVLCALDNKLPACVDTSARPTTVKRTLRVGQTSRKARHTDVGRGAEFSWKILILQDGQA